MRSRLEETFQHQLTQLRLDMEAKMAKALEEQSRKMQNAFDVHVQEIRELQDRYCVLAAQTDMLAAKLMTMATSPQPR